MNRSSKFIAAAALLAATPAFASTTIDLSATDYSSSSFTQLFDAGEYTVSLVQGKYTAWSPARTGVDSSGNNIPGANWTDYYAYTIGGGTINYVNPLSNQRFATAADAFTNYSASGPLTLSFTAPTSVTFSIADYPDSFWDNTGGVSLKISAVPEPGTWMMMILGFFGIGLAVRGSRRNGRTTAAA